jgi:mannose-6-phosphate isomerase-like protein (cupin superfamily)
MKKLFCAPLLALALVSLLAQTAKAPDGIMVWKAADLKAYAGKLAPRVAGAQKIATQTLANLNGNNAMMVHREATGEAELHENAADFMIVVDGEANVVLGGAIPDGKSTGPGEIRGTTIDGGKTYAIEPGDIVNIPAKTPHQVVIAPGKQVTCFLLKVAAK